MPDNALAASFIGLFKAELLRPRGPWRGLDDLEMAILEWVDWFNHRRLHGELAMVPPAEFEQNFEVARKPDALSGDLRASPPGAGATNPPITGPSGPSGPTSQLYLGALAGPERPRQTQ